MSIPPPSVVGTPHPSLLHRHPTEQQRGIHGHHAAPSSPSEEGSALRGTLQTDSVPLHWTARAANLLQHPTLYKYFTSDSIVPVRHTVYCENKINYNASSSVAQVHV